MVHRSRSVSSHQRKVQRRRARGMRHELSRGEQDVLSALPRVVAHIRAAIEEAVEANVQGDQIGGCDALSDVSMPLAAHLDV